MIHGGKSDIPVVIGYVSYRGSKAQLSCRCRGTGTESLKRGGTYFCVLYTGVELPNLFLFKNKHIDQFIKSKGYDRKDEKGKP